ncbi:type II secretion system F family protein [Chitinimonas sp.]|uniref:type II secretion system F family protein n=1 Tax=Chitinimonas sp. TaxID=1934313 RepID=UPI0035B1020D
MQYKYLAIDQAGRQVRGQTEAANLVDLESRLNRLGLYLIEEREVEYRPSLFGGKSIRRADLITFCFHMEQLTRAGVSLLEGLDDLRDSLENQHFQQIIATMIEDIEGGLQLSQAMNKHPTVFDAVFSNLIQSGEATGRLPDVLLNLTETLKAQDELAAQTKKIIMYPAFVGTVILGVIAFLMIYLVPKLVGFIKNMQQTLPWNTKVLIAVSDFFVNDWPVIVASPFILLFAMWLWKRSDPQYQYKVDGIKLKIPVIGPLLKKIVLARFANYFAMMYDAGITILDSLRILEGVLGNLVLAKGLTEVRELISEGQGVSSSFERVRMFPPLVIRMLRVGESTGALDNALRNVSYFYDRDVKESIEKAQALIEPVMTVVLGLILGSVMISVLGPIYDLLTKLKT